MNIVLSKFLKNRKRMFLILFFISLVSSFFYEQKGETPEILGLIICLGLMVGGYGFVATMEDK